MEENILISIKQDDSLASVTTNHTDGTSARKIVPLRNLIDAINDVSVTELDGALLGAIPIGYLESQYHSPGNFSIWISLPEQIRTLTYYGKAYQIPFPPLLFYFEVLKTNVVKSFLFATKGTPAPGATLFRYPFGNVYGNGRICWGNLSLPKITALKDTELLIKAFFMSETNDDLFKSEQGKTQRQLLHSLRKKFPLSTLHRADIKLSYENFGGNLHGSV
jgi:hypothetical protein